MKRPGIVGPTDPISLMRPVENVIRGFRLGRRELRAMLDSQCHTQEEITVAEPFIGRDITIHSSVKRINLARI